MTTSLLSSVTSSPPEKSKLVVLPSLGLPKNLFDSVFEDSDEKTFNNLMVIADFLTEYIKVLNSGKLNSKQKSIKAKENNEKKTANESFVSIDYGDIVQFEDFKLERNAGSFFVDYDESADQLFLVPFNFTYDEYGNLPITAVVFDYNRGNFPLGYFSESVCHNTFFWLNLNDDEVEELTESKNTFTHDDVKYTLVFPKGFEYKDYDNEFVLPIEKYEGTTLYVAEYKKGLLSQLEPLEDSEITTIEANKDIFAAVNFARSILIKKMMK